MQVVWSLLGFDSSLCTQDGTKIASTYCSKCQETTRASVNREQSRFLERIVSGNESSCELDDSHSLLWFFSVILLFFSRSLFTLYSVTVYLYGEVLCWKPGATFSKLLRKILGRLLVTGKSQENM